MPNRRYHPRNPPTRWDHVLAHPYEVLIALGGFLACLLLLLSQVGAPATISPTMAGLPALVAWLVGVTGVVGNALVLAGIFDGSEDLMRGWMLERVGLVGAITSWGAYSVAVASEFPGSVISYSLTFLVALAHAVRLTATLSEESSTRTAIRTHGEQ